MTTFTARRSSVSAQDLERFADFKAKKQAKKEAEKQKLINEFPLLFKKDKDPKVRKAAAKAIATPNKKRILIGDKENNPRSNKIGKTPTKPLNVKTPLKTTKTPSKTLKTVVESSKPKDELQKPEPAQLIIEKIPEKLNEKPAVELSPVENEPKIVQEVEEPIEQPEEEVEEETTKVSLDVDDQVLDVLEFMKESEEIDEDVFRRISNENLSRGSLRRLSMASLKGDPINNIESITKEENTPSDEEKKEQEESSEEDTPLPVEDVFNAMRFYIASTAKLQEKNKEISTQADEVSGYKEVENSSNNKLITAEPIMVLETQETIIEKKEISIIQETNDFLQKPNETQNNSIIEDNLKTIPVAAIEERNSIFEDHMEHKLEQESCYSPQTKTESVAGTVSPTCSLNHSVMGSPVNKVVISPKSEMFDQALARGLVIAELVDRLEFQGHIRYVIQVQILWIPGVPEWYKDVRMVLIKRYSEFKYFRQCLLKAMETQDQERRTSGEPIPPLPTRQIMSLGFGWSEETFLNTRQKFLANWVEKIFNRQSVEGLEFRAQIKQFLSV